MTTNTSAAFDRIVLALDEGKEGLARSIARGLRGEAREKALGLIEGSSRVVGVEPRVAPALDTAPVPFRSEDDQLTTTLKSSVYGNVHPMDISNFIIENFEQLLGGVKAGYGAVADAFAPYLSKPFKKFAGRPREDALRASIGSALYGLVKEGRLEEPTRWNYRLPINPVPFEASVPKGLYTIEFEDGEHRTYRVRKLPSNAKMDAGRMVLELLTGPHNESDYIRVGLADPLTLDRPNARHEHACKVLSDAANAESAGMLFALRESACRRCGRTLTVPASKCQGLGPECAKKVTA